MMKYHQSAVLAKLNTYLDLNKRPLQLNHGYCHGFSLLWLYEMSIHNEEWFYQTLQRIVECKTLDDFNAIEFHIEKLLAHIEWLQNSSDYLKNVNQLDIDQVLELPRTLSLSYQFTRKQLRHVLERIIHENEMICLSGPDHSIGVFRRENKMYLFDPNYTEGQAKEFIRLGALKSEIIHCLFDHRTLPNKLIPLEINIAYNPYHPSISPHTLCTSEDKTEIFKNLINDTTGIHHSPLINITNLNLACESGDEEELFLLLQKGLNPNIVVDADASPLFFAMQRGYIHIVKLLLENGADPNFANTNNYSPLMIAIELGQIEIAKLLLYYGAAPYYQANRFHTTFSLAIKNKQWELLTHLLASNFEKLAGRVNKVDMLALRWHIAEIKQAATISQHQFTSDQNDQLNQIIAEISHKSAPLKLFSCLHKRKPINDAIYDKNEPKLYRQ